MMGEAHILYEVSGNVVLLTLNRPEVRNAFSAEMIRLWREYLEKAQADAAARVIVVTGKGDNFCSGGTSGTWRKGSSSPGR